MNRVQSGEFITEHRAALSNAVQCRYPTPEMPMPADPSKWEMVDDAMAAILRRKSEAERLAIAFGMSRFAQQMIRANLKAEHSDWTAEQLQRETARRISHGAV
jgi:Rv0078B-related antitoxin